MNKNLKVNSILNVIKTISSIIFPLITFPYISRVLQPTNIGKVNFGSSYISYFTLIATLGITTYAIRECSAAGKDKEKLTKVASEIFSINICTTLISYMLLFVSLILFRRLDSYRTLIIIQSTVILFTTLGADWLNTAMEDFEYITIRTVSFQLISLALMFTFVKSPDDYIKYAFLTVLSSSGASVLNIFYRRKYCKVQFTLDMQWNVHFKPIILLFVMILAQTIFRSADITMLGLMQGDYDVGIYSTAVKIESIIAQVVSSLAWVVMPRMSYYFQEGDYERINNMLKKVLGLLLLIGLPSVAGAISLSKEIVLLIGGVEYGDAAMPLVILMVSFMFSLLGGSFLGNMVLLPSRNEKVYMQVCCITAVVNVVLNYVLIPYWGVNAAAFTTAVSAFLILVLLLKYKDQRIRLYYIIDVGTSPLIGSVLIMVVCGVIGKFGLNHIIKIVVSVIASVVSYGLTMLVLKNSLCMEMIALIKGKIIKY